jgi:hypothetical protein
MIEECPHCHHRVVLTPDGECPSCRRNVGERRDAESSVVRVMISAEEVLPSCCITCGRDTVRARRMRLRRLTPEAAGARDDRLEFLVELDPSGFGLLLALPCLLLIRLFRVGEDRIGARIPMCRWCEDVGVRISPRHVNWDTHHIVLLGHREFRKRLEESWREAIAARSPRSPNTG